MLKASASVYPENHNSGIQKIVTRDPENRNKGSKRPLSSYYGSLVMIFLIPCYVFLEPTVMVFWTVVEKEGC